MPYNPDIHHRRSIRLPGYDYAQPGTYFITACTHNRECLFGDIVDGAVRLNEMGRIVAEEWIKTGTIRPEITLDEWVVMPNHFHGILCIDDHVGAHGMRPGDLRTNNRAHIGAPLRRQSRSIGSIMAGFKSASTKRINHQRNTPGGPIWQRNYYEHVIRNETDLRRIRDYVATNPAKWELDSLYREDP